ncbi:MAG: hypothetical protein U0X87_17205 [Anaerolineales bacterium]
MNPPLPQGERVRGEGENKVIQIRIPREELTSEIAALRLSDGEGAKS